MKVSIALSSAGLVIFAVSSVVHTEEQMKDGDNDDGALGDFLKVRPDLADDLSSNDASLENEPGAMNGAMPKLEGNVQGAKEQKDGIDCITGCGPQDQSCRARCLGVPGVASRKMPRKQDIDGNLPLNWKVRKDQTVLASFASFVGFEWGTYGMALVFANMI